MAAAAISTPRSERVARGRLWWVGPLAIAGAVGANVATRYIAGKLLALPPEFEHLDYSWIIGFTVAGVSGAVLTFAAIGRFAQHPIRLFRIVSAVALVLSFIPGYCYRIWWIIPAGPSDRSFRSFSFRSGVLDHLLGTHPSRSGRPRRVPGRLALRLQH